MAIFYSVFTNSTQGQTQPPTKGLSLRFVSLSQHNYIIDLRQANRNACLPGHRDMLSVILIKATQYEIGHKP